MRVQGEGLEWLCGEASIELSLEELHWHRWRSERSTTPVRGDNKNMWGYFKGPKVIHFDYSFGGQSIRDHCEHRMLRFTYRRPPIPSLEGQEKEGSAGRFVEWQMAILGELHPAGLLDFIKAEPHEETCYFTFGKGLGKTLCLWEQWLYVPWHMGLVVLLLLKSKVLCFYCFFPLQPSPNYLCILWKYHWWRMGGFRISIKCQNLPTMAPPASWLLTPVLWGAPGTDSRQKCAESLKHRYTDSWAVDKSHVCLLLSTKKIFFQMKCMTSVQKGAFQLNGKLWLINQPRTVTPSSPVARIAHLPIKNNKSCSINIPFPSSPSLGPKLAS